MGSPSNTLRGDRTAIDFPEGTTDVFPGDCHDGCRSMLGTFRVDSTGSAPVCDDARFDTLGGMIHFNKIEERLDGE